MNKFAPHFQRFTTEMRDLIAEWKPPLMVWVDPNPYGIEEIRRVSPWTFIFGRKNEEGGWNSPDLRARAYYWADECARMGLCDAYYVWNEPISHDDVDNFGRLDDFHMWFRERILTHGMEAIGLNVGTGNFTLLDDIAECFPKTCASFKHIGIHEYDWIIDPAKRPVDTGRLGYYWDRWPYWLEDIGRDDVMLWVTECGMTQAVHEGRPDEGWRSDADGMTDDDYIAWADWYNRQLVKDSRLGGAALFNFAGYGWETFEHLGWGRLGEILALDAPNGGNDVGIKVYDRDNNVKDWDWLVENYGPVEVHPITETYQPAEGEIVYKVVYFREKTGDANCVINVRDVDGNPVSEETVMWGWPDAPPHNYGDKPWDWTDGTGDPGDTNVNGDVGPGMGSGAFYWPPDGEIGPHWIWIWDRPSEFVKGIGMISGTNHDHLDVGYRAVIWGGDEPTPPPDDVAEQIRYHTAEIDKLTYQIDGNPTKMTLDFDGIQKTYELTEV